MADIHHSCKKRTAYAWAKYYEQIGIENDNARVMITVVQQIDRNNIPNHISSEFIEMADALKKKHTCPVCLDLVDRTNIKITYCGHIYCSECLENIKNSTMKCAICRKPL